MTCSEVGLTVILTVSLVNTPCVVAVETVTTFLSAVPLNMSVLTVLKL